MLEPKQLSQKSVKVLPEVIAQASSYVDLLAEDICGLIYTHRCNIQRLPGKP